ncbi:MAG: hypothetical protein ABIT96_04465 [Ferruginibacter sp.]
MQASIKIALLFLFLPCIGFGQDITGLWQGTLFNDTTHQYYKYEIGISQNERGKLTGFSHTWFLLDDKQYYGVKKLRISRANDGKIIIEDNGLISNNYPVSPAKHVRQLNVLTLTITPEAMQMSGPFATNRTKEYSSLTGSVSLVKKSDFRESALIPHLQELELDDELSFVKAENESLAGLARKEYEAEMIAHAGIPKPSTNIVHKKATQTDYNDIAYTKTGNEIPASTTPPVHDKPSTAINKSLEPAAALTTDIPVTRKTKKDKRAEDINTESLPVEKADEKLTAEASQPASIKNVGIVQQPIPVKSSTAKAGITGVMKSDLNVDKNFINPVADFTKRTTILQKTVMFKTDSLQLALYDNGEVDGDTVSIFMNGALLMSRQGLSTNAIRKTIYIDPAMDSITLVMYAENLGTIAPNTGLLVVRDGKDLYEIRFSGDLQKNAAIMFRRRRQ